MPARTIRLDLPTLDYDASEGEIAFAALLVHRQFPSADARHGRIELPLKGGPGAPTLARVDKFDRRRPRVFKVVASESREVRDGR